MKINKVTLLLSVLSVILFSGCSTGTTVPLEPKEISKNAKFFNIPPENKAGLYVYRDKSTGVAAERDIWIDNECLGRASNKVFFYQSIEGNKKYKLSTESEFSANSISLKTKSGKNYYVRQYIKTGLFVGGANLEIVEEAKAKKGLCNKPHITD